MCKQKAKDAGLDYQTKKTIHEKEHECCKWKVDGINQTKQITANVFFTWATLHSFGHALINGEQRFTSIYMGFGLNCELRHVRTEVEHETKSKSGFCIVAYMRARLLPKPDMGFVSCLTQVRTRQSPIRMGLIFPPLILLIEPAHSCFSQPVA